MNRFYKANIELKEYLESKGLTYHPIENEDVYYLTQHSSGKQLRIDPRVNLITVLNEKGNTISESNIYTTKQLNGIFELED